SGRAWRSSISASAIRSPSRSSETRHSSTPRTAGCSDEMAMNILVCVKRVPATGGRISLTPDGQEIDTRFASFTVSPHEECGVEEALRLVEARGGTVTVLTLGPEVAAEQLRDALAMGAHRAILLQTDGREWDPSETARAIVDAIRSQEAKGERFDLLLFGNE